MFRSLSLFITIIFILWLVPLGVFIVPSKEKLLCDGQRAICLCSHRSVMKTDDGLGKTLVKAASPSQKESSPSSGNHFVNVRPHGLSMIVTAALWFEEKDLYSLRVDRPLEHVPKV